MECTLEVRLFGSVIHLNMSTGNHTMHRTNAWLAPLLRPRCSFRGLYNTAVRLENCFFYYFDCLLILILEILSVILFLLFLYQRFLLLDVKISIKLFTIYVKINLHKNNSCFTRSSLSVCFHHSSK